MTVMIRRDLSVEMAIIIHWGWSSSNSWNDHKQ